MAIPKVKCISPCSELSQIQLHSGAAPSVTLPESNWKWIKGHMEKFINLVEGPVVLLDVFYIVFELNSLLQRNENTGPSPPWFLSYEWYMSGKGLLVAMLDPGHRSSRSKLFVPRPSPSSYTAPRGTPYGYFYLEFHVLLFYLFHALRCTELGGQKPIHQVILLHASSMCGLMGVSEH